VQGRAAGQPRIDGAFRDAHRLDQPDAIGVWFLPWLEAMIVREALLSRRGLAPFQVGVRELQVTRHGDGGFFSVHTDAAAYPATLAWSRHLTFIYYFHRLPRGFSGGDLPLFDAAAGGDFSFTRIDPAHNPLVLFQSTRLHTVTRVYCPSDDPLEGRWTVNGWLNRCVGA
jgi:SM-20-related protein